ncbi:4-alpha-glucanotransferase [Sphingosinicella sp. CPCC 101087]|uniref:4-alpha-glucanotransferase n=1 Tax=Sphingosinicella sp. CPCC 101087 TaxID=2497754 RepID=UPI00101C1126|nr:4-alpha-glucanotransferase [Sphingosinicella sp. CPCC 101087]
MSGESPLHRRAREAGLQRQWTDAAGKAQVVSDDTLVAALDALGETGESETPPLVTAELGEPVRLPSGRMLPGYDEPGYHDAGDLTVAVAPPRAWTPDDAVPGRKAWGAAVQLPSLRDRRGEPFGDFAALARLAAAAGQAGADALAISPVHALFPADPVRYSPYGPSTRLFLNVLFADPGTPPAFETAGELIDWEGAIPERLARLRRRYDARDPETRDAVEVFRREQGESLERHARYDALYAHFLRERGSRGWHEWPEAYRDPAGAAVAEFARGHADEIGFYLFLQWLADQGLAGAQAAARDAGMGIGIIADMAVGMDPGGSHAWSAQGALLSGLSVGAPPDLLGPEGQDWGITTFSPPGLKRTGFRDFIATIRAALRHAGGIRIDHALGLKRLWVVPHGFPATEGVYLDCPERDLMRLLALESWRAKAIVVGEDLGTIPPGFGEEMDSRGLLGMRVLWFERTRSGGYKPPDQWDAGAAAMTSTHDLPTVAGWWCERDIDWTWRIGRSSGFASSTEERAARAKERRRLWRAIGDGGREPAKDQPERAVTAAIEQTGRSRCRIAIIPAEDLLGLAEQPNLPGTIDEHPNWRRRLPVLAEDMLDAPPVRERVAKLAAARRS